MEDTLLIAARPVELQILINRMSETCNKYGLKVNTSNTKLMIVRKISMPSIQIRIQPIEKVNNITDLSANILHITLRIRELYTDRQTEYSKLWRLLKFRSTGFSGLAGWTE